MKQTYPLLIFDLGNVIFKINFSKAIDYWSKTAHVPTRYVKERFRQDRAYRSFERSKISEQSYFKSLRDQLELSISVEELIIGWNSIYGPIVTNTQRAIAILSKSTKVVALTNTNTTHKAIWAKMYADELTVFEKIYTSSDLGMRKPSREIFEYILEDMNVSASETVFFDDTEENIEGATVMGIHAVLVESDHTVAAWIRDNYTS